MIYFYRLQVRLTPQEDAFAGFSVLHTSEVHAPSMAWEAQSDMIGLQIHLLVCAGAEMRLTVPLCPFPH